MGVNPLSPHGGNTPSTDRPGNGDTGGGQDTAEGPSLDGDHPNPADQAAGYNNHNTPSGAGTQGGDTGGGQDTAEGPNLDGDHPNPADQAAGYNNHNTPSGAGTQGGDTGGEQDATEGPNLDGDHPNPADQAAGYNNHNTPSGAGTQGGDTGGEQDATEGPNLDGDHPNPADQAAGYNNHNTPSGAGTQGGDTGGEQDATEGPNLDGDHPNPADQAAGYNDHNTPSGPSWGGGGEGGDGGGGGGGDGGGSGGGKPVLLDLDGDGVELVALEDSSAFYDIRGDGFRYHLSWVAPDDGLLAYDRDGDGRIGERGEISFVDYVEGANTDLDGLRHFDTNDDNVLDSADREWSKFTVWRDLDQDGESDPGELRSLDDAGVRSISLASSGEEETRADGTRVFGRGTYVGTAGGAPATRELLDVALAVAPWGFRTTEAGMEVRWGQGEDAADGFIATSDAPVTLDVAAGGYRSAMGGAGDDRLTNSGGRTSMLAGLAGADVLRGGTAGDLLLGGDGDDALYGGAGTDILDGGGGADRIEGGTGDDLVHGGAGGDTLDGGAGRDTLSYETSGAGVTLDLRDGDGDGFHDAASGGHAAGDRIGGFEDVVGSAHTDRLTGDASANRLEGGAGRDLLYGGAGDDTVMGGAGDDAVIGDGGADELYGGAGDDYLRGGSGDDVLIGGAGADWLKGEGGDDTLEAGDSDGTSWQWLDGGSGNDTYRVGKGDGLVEIDSWAEDADTGSSDRVVFTDLSLAEVSFGMQRWGPLNVEWAKDGTSGVLSVADAGRHIERYEFADGSVLSRFEAERLVGTGQGERIATGSGNDRIDGGGGDDTLSGGAGDDAYEFSGRAFGRDRVSDAGGSDSVEFTSGVAWDQLWFSRAGDDLRIELMGTDSEVAVEGWWSGAEADAGARVETIVAGDRALASSAVQRLVQAMAGMDGPASGQTTLSAAQREQMATSLAAWQEVAGS